MIVKLTLGVWLVSTLIFFYFFIFDSSRERESTRSRSKHQGPPIP